MIESEISNLREIRDKVAKTETVLNEIGSLEEEKS
jgi:hypothetical protein